MAFDYKKEYKEYYLPPKTPTIVDIPVMNYIAIRGKGDPNKPDGYFSYVIPPLEGLWWQNDSGEIDYSRKGNFEWISMIRLPEFVTKEEFDWAITEATQKKKTDFSKVFYFTYKEGLSVQCMHIGSYDEEPDTIQKMNDLVQKNNYSIDMSSERLHHEIYLCDPRRTSPEKLRTVIRHPIKSDVR